MNGHDDEAWLQSMLQRRPPSELSDGGFQHRVLQRLPRRERPAMRLLALGTTWGVTAAFSLLSWDAGVFSSSGMVPPVVPFSFGTALLWYLVDALT
ncbi:hypothetical protein [Cystobacter ferrugineus]|uniref:Uncharacterized protein n=1 Tax=Cystobacter ferrugineus TaxID=83449 RepID=A0A1L9B489_9BACT|nr:hypothetical protein [Cystobacter ferrugineus]OJH37003.1 hypothetical protein BON30_31455 [Cystobacter ferrugineus]